MKPTRYYQSSIISDEQKNRIEEDVRKLKSQVEERKAKLENLSNERGEFKHQLSSIARENERISQKGHELNEVRKQYSMVKSTIESLESKFQELNNDARKDVSQKIKAVEASISKELKIQTDLLKQMVGLMGNVNSCQKELFKADLEYLEAKNNDVSMNDVIGFFNDREDELKKEFETKRETVRRLRDTEEYQQWIRQIRSYDDSTREKLNDYAEGYEKDGTFNVTHITEIIDKLESEISMINHDASSITILKQVEKEISQLEETLPKQQVELKSIKEKIKQGRSTLEPKLDEIIEKISTRFSRLFKNVGSAGAVNLVKPHQFSEWKIEIMVKFRDNATLKRLDSHTQSGGERAVSTVLYLSLIHI